MVMYILERAAPLPRGAQACLLTCDCPRDGSGEEGHREDSRGEEVVVEGEEREERRRRRRRRRRRQNGQIEEEAASHSICMVPSRLLKLTLYCCL